MKYLYELVDLLNQYDGSNREMENRIRDLVCYISDSSEYMQIDLYRSIVFEAAQKLRMFGYIKGTNRIAQDEFFYDNLGQFTRNYTQTVKRAADNKRRYAPGWVHSTCLLRGFPKGAAPHLAHDFAEQSVVCYTLCRRCPENTVAAGEGKGI